MSESAPTPLFKERNTMMDFDVNNQQMLAAGAYYATNLVEGGGWRSMDKAPRDGTTIEVRCTYGVAPWFGLYHWIETPNVWISPADGGDARAQSGRWAAINDEASSFSEDLSFSWRPHSGALSAYVDPTGGAQNSAAYWRGAVATKRGLPLNYFEKTTAANRAPNERSKLPRTSFWRRLLGE